MQKPVILTGLRSNSQLTLGNYFGGMLPIIDMATHRSSDYQVNMFIPDLHSFTTPIDHDQLYEQTLQNARLFTAAGLPLDNENIYLYRQSYVPAHSELTWILDCFTGMGEMSRMTQFKDKSGIHSWKENKTYIRNHLLEMRQLLGNNYTAASVISSIDLLIEGIQAAEDASDASVGLFNYPVLMTADILLYGARYVPVGDDQTQHLEFARDIAQRLNSRFGDLFVIPEPVKKQHEFFGKDQGLRVKDLQNPTKKMSKSDESGRGVIYLSDDPKAAAKKVMSATTDSVGTVHFDRNLQPGISNLLEILALLRGQPLQQTVTEFEGMDRYGDFKAIVAASVEEFLAAFQTKLTNVNDHAILEKLAVSEQAMNDQANRTLLRVQQAVGLRSRSI